MSDELMVQNDAGWGLLAQIPLRLSVEIGSVSRTMQDLLDLKQGAVIELDRPIDEPVDILANGTVIARGEVVTGDAVDEIANCARRIEADLIVVGHKHLDGWASRWWRGSVSKALIEHSPCSVLVVITP